MKHVLPSDLLLTQGLMAHGASAVEHPAGKHKMHVHQHQLIFGPLSFSSGGFIQGENVVVPGRKSLHKEQRQARTHIQPLAQQTLAENIGMVVW